MRQVGFLFLWLLVFTVPWEEMLAIRGMASFAKIIGIVVAAMGLMTVLVTGRLRFPLCLGWLALYACWCAASTQWSSNSGDAFSRALTYFQLSAVIVWLVCQLADDAKSLKSLMRAFVLGTGLLVVNLFLGYIHSGVSLLSEEHVRFSAERANANEVGLCSR